MSVTVDPPSQLPVDNLSVSSINLLLKCPEKWRRRYIEREYEPPSGAMILGSAAGAAEAQHYSTVIETGEGLSNEQVLDEFSSEWEDRIGREEVDWREDKPGVLKDSGIATLDVYHTQIAPQVVPVSVERRFELSWEGVDWSLIGYLDLEDADGNVADYKMRGRKLSQIEADTELQPFSYLYARRAESNPAPAFKYHAMVRVKQPYAEVVSTSRTDRQLDAFADRVFAAAREIEWRTLNDSWQGAVPGSWWCSERFCGHWFSCRFGGLK